MRVESAARAAELDLAVAPERAGRVDRLLGMLPAVPVMAWVLIFILAPIAIMAVFSLWRYRNFDLEPIWNLDNYRAVFQQRMYARVMLRTLEIAVLVTMGCIALAYPFAYFLARKVRRWRGVLLILQEGRGADLHLVGGALGQEIQGPDHPDGPAVRDIPAVAIYLGFKEPFNLSDDQLGQVKKKLMEQRPLIKTFTAASSDFVKAMASGEGDLGFCPSPGIVYRIKDAGGPDFGFVVPKEGTTGWVEATC